MSKKSFKELLGQRCQSVGTHLCVGLDPDWEKFPEHVRKMDDPLLFFLEKIIGATKEYAAAFKPNFAFFEAFGGHGREVLAKLRTMVPAGIPIILDAKVADIGNTSAKYAKAFFEDLGMDALTVNPYMGTDSVAPFLEYQEKGVFLLCLTSNKGSFDLQKQLLGDGGPLFMSVARLIKKWDSEYGNCCAVVGATHPDVMRDLRAVLDTQPLLVPGVGAQGGDIEAVCHHIITKRKLPTVINASRSILYASADTNFDQAAAAAAERMFSTIKRFEG